MAKSILVTVKAKADKIAKVKLSESHIKYSPFYNSSGSMKLYLKEVGR